MFGVWGGWGGQVICCLLILKRFVFWERFVIPSFNTRNFYQVHSKVMLEIWSDFTFRRLGGTYCSMCFILFVLFFLIRNIWTSNCLVRILLKRILLPIKACFWHWRAERSKLSSTPSRCPASLVRKCSIRFVKIWNRGYSIIFTCQSYYDHDNDRD